MSARQNPEQDAVSNIDLSHKRPLGVELDR